MGGCRPGDRLAFWPLDANEMTGRRSVAEPELERQGRRLGRPARWFLFLAVVVAVPGIVLILFTGGWAQAVGIVLVALSGPPCIVAVGLLLSSLVARWSARHRSFA